MALTLAFLRNSRISVIDISSSYLYIHDLYSVMSDIYFMITLYSYLILCKIRRENLVPRHLIHTSFVCSSMVSAHPEGGAPHKIVEYCLLM